MPMMHWIALVFVFKCVPVTETDTNTRGKREQLSSGRLRETEHSIVALAASVLTPV